MHLYQTSLCIWPKVSTNLKKNATVSGFFSTFNFQALLGDLSLFWHLQYRLVALSVRWILWSTVIFGTWSRLNCLIWQLSRSRSFNSLLFSTSSVETDSFVWYNLHRGLDKSENIRILKSLSIPRDMPPWLWQIHFRPLCTFQLYDWFPQLFFRLIRIAWNLFLSAVHVICGFLQASSIRCSWFSTAVYRVNTVVVATPSNYTKIRNFIRFWV